MWSSILNIILLIGKFSLTDRLLTNLTNFEGIYYLIHSYHNGVIVYLTGNEVYNSLTDFNYIKNSEKNIVALEYVFALHLYHVLIYWKKFSSVY